ncbi:TlpA family protein disulfide reductase [Lutibacter maritimus]|uniref:Peroxiredoxin n=1 Tax=Lutibacter maritimus TaxID=593133 RepID=A0A1I6SBY3_9FLAO|nr:TlpA disulfide reductase family protein [Lutibacter maritimus]SFS74459.1 Peroxiredoxin [Lutibacter maritimus]
MKKIWLLLALVIVVSCENDSTLNFVILSGKVTNNKSKEILIKGIDNSISESIKLSDDGSFIDTLFVENGVYTLNYGRNKAQIYFEGGNNLIVNFDNKDFDNSLNFSGDGSGESAYVYAKAKKLKEAKFDDMKVYELPENEFKNYLKEIKSSLENTLNSTDGVSRNFKSKEVRNLNYAYINKLENYKVYHSFLTKNYEYEVPEGFLNETKEIKYDNEDDYLFSSEYRNLLLSYYRKKSFEQLKDNAAPIELTFINTVAGIKNETIKNGLLLNYTNTMFSKIKDKDSFYKAFLAASTSEENNKIVTDLYDKSQLIAEGKPSPIFTDYEKLDGSKVSLSDFKGKFVYMYVWSSSFSPSTEQIKNFNELQKKYSDKNIEFIALSVDRISNKDGWKEAIKKEDFNGTHIIADKGKESDFIQNYAIVFPPRFIFINAEGNIIDADAPRPSDLKLEKLFNQQNI